jgi:hypothetical protein
MNAEDQIEKARIYREHLANTDRKRSIMIAIALAGATIISVGFLGFAFVQKTRADAMKLQVEQLKVEVEMGKLELNRVSAQLDACMAQATNR